MPIAVGPVALVDPRMCAAAREYENLTPRFRRRTIRLAADGRGVLLQPFRVRGLLQSSRTRTARDRDPAGYALYLLDRWNNRDLIYATRTSRASRPSRDARPRPAVLPEAGTGDDNVARVCVLDVYQGLTGIERGQVKYLRVIEEVPSRVGNCIGFGLQHPVISNNGISWSRSCWASAGEEDGSVYFEAPARRRCTSPPG